MQTTRMVAPEGFAGLDECEPMVVNTARNGTNNYARG
jgi:hypothetical protein